MSNSIVSNGCEYTAQGEYKCPVKAEEGFRQITEHMNADKKAELDNCCNQIKKLANKYTTEDDKIKKGEDGKIVFDDHPLSLLSKENMKCADENNINTCSGQIDLIMEKLANDRSNWITLPAKENSSQLQEQIKYIKNKYKLKEAEDAQEILFLLGGYGITGSCHSCLGINEGVVQNADGTSTEVIRKVCGQARVVCNSLDKSEDNIIASSKSA